MNFNFGRQFFLFGFFLANYLAKKVKLACFKFEQVKNLVVSGLLWKRGILHRPFTHLSILILIISTFVLSGVLRTNLLAGEDGEPQVDSYKVEFVTPITIISEKPRDEIAEYEVLGGDTVSAIAEKFQISVDTVRWTNDLSDVDTIRPGDKLKILPVSGVAHKVASGDTIYSVAKKYRIEAQAILDFPFNDIGNDLGLQIDQILIVPDGVPPSKPKPAPTQYLAYANIPVDGTGLFAWPASGYIGQYFAYYHRGIDIVNSSGPGVAAADSGQVIVSGWPDNTGYGRRVIIDHGNGYTSLYAHLAATYMSVGQNVTRGQVIGKMGTTGRSSGVHLHLEIRKNGVAINPLSLLR